MTFRVLVTGSRDWVQPDVIWEALRAVNAEFAGPKVLVHGAARGADTTAEAFARELGWAIEAHPADWDRYGKRAGFVRNAEMVASGIDYGLAFIRNSSPGASMALKLMIDAGIKGRVFRQETLYDR